MDFVCPLCNALNSVNLICNNCNKKIKDLGRETDYYDSYSPNLPLSLTAKIDGYPSNKCVHLFYCENCGREYKFPIDKKKI
ncbi:MAG TPA: hypothetical protein PKK61_00510 [Defluviitaleaceae bacterium]|jgi:hypothetical protein|nr:hypothetical protein [Candidatus Epulonipiscium sp.]HOA79533.1 hypothetical protein [Defluviitaleaceae bacterium]